MDEKFKKNLKGFKAIVEQLHPPGVYAHWIDGMFYYDVRNTPKALTVSAVDQGILLNAADTSRVATLVDLILTDPKNVPVIDGIAVPKTFNDLRSTFRSVGQSMSKSAKFEVLSWAGQIFKSRFDNRVSTATITCDQILTNARSDGMAGGQCEGIHQCIELLAKELGFKNAGEQSTNWGRGMTGDDHYVAHYQDPDTHEYYMQNYDSIYNTHQKIETQAIDVSNRILSPLVGNSFVESLPGVIHEYQDNRTRWAKDRLMSAADLGGERSMLSFRIGNQEQMMQAEIGDASIKGFLMHDSYMASDGVYSIEALGVSKIFGAKKRLSTRALSELGYAGQVYGGVLAISDPILSADQDNGKSQTRLNGFFGGHLRGYARIDDFTGQLRVDTKMLDIGAPVDDHRGQGADRAALNLTMPENAITASVKYSPKGQPFSIGVDRVVEITTRTSANLTPMPRLAQDRIHLVVDTRAYSPKFYVVNEADVYLFGGLEKSDAVGLKDRFKAAVGPTRFGEFGAFVEISDVVSNRAKDPFYDSYLSAVFGADWKKRVNRLIEIGASARISNPARKFFSFENPGEATPEIGTMDGVQVNGMVYLRATH